MRNIGTNLVLSVLLAFVACPLYGAAPLGIFEDHLDVGEPNIPGSADFQNGTYTVDAVGATIGRDSLTDQFHFVYKKMKGSFAIQGAPTPMDNVGWGGLMIRQDLDPDSVHASLLMTSDAAKQGTEALEFSVYPVFRSMKGGATKWQGDPEPGGLTNNHTGPLRIERFGNSFYFYTFNTKGNKFLIRTEVVPMDDEVWVGLAATAEDATAYGTFEFDKVTIEEYPLSVTRTFPVDTYQKGATLSPVTLTAEVRAGQVSDATVVETLPPGAISSNIKVSAGTFSIGSDGTISWILAGLTGTASLTYDLKVAQFDSISFPGTFTNGVNPKSFIGGDDVLPKISTFPTEHDPIVIDPNYTTVIQAEQGVPSTENGWALLLDPRNLSGITAECMGSNSQTVLAFPITILQEGTYYIFGKVRGDDGNSDSFHFSVDDLPAGDDSSRWNINGDKKYAIRWVSSESPVTTQRSFLLTKGDHTLYLGERESDTSIDWLAITMTKNLNLGTFSELTKSITAVRVLPDLPGAIPSSVEVKVSLSVRQGVSLDAMVQETPPPGWAIASVSPGAGKAQVDGGKIIWTIPQAKNEVVLTYTVTPKAGDKVGFFVGQATDQSYSYTIDVAGNQYFPVTLNFEPLTNPINVGDGVVFLQAENAHAFTGQMAVRPDAGLTSQFYVIALSSGVANGKTTDQEITFKLNMLKTGTYYLFANCRAENSQSNSFYAGFDVNFVNLAESDDYGYLIPSYGAFVRSWFQTYNPGGFFWDITGVPRPFELTAGLHTLSWHSRNVNAKVDWIAITTDPTLDINAVEPGQTPPTGVESYMLY